MNVGGCMVKSIHAFVRDQAAQLDSPQLHEFINQHTSLAQTLAKGLASG